MNAHADMQIVVSTQQIKHTKGHLPLSCFGVRSLLDFVVPKQAPINAFYNMSSCFTSVSDDMFTRMRAELVSQ